MSYFELLEHLRSVRTVNDLQGLAMLLDHHNVSRGGLGALEESQASRPGLLYQQTLYPFITFTKSHSTMANKYNADVINTKVGQDELMELQCELFAAAREALSAARTEGKIPSSLLTSCHQIIRDSGLRPDAEGRGDDEEFAAVNAQFGNIRPSWLQDAADAIKDLDSGHD